LCRALSWNELNRPGVRDFLAANIDTAYPAPGNRRANVPNVDSLRVSGAVGECTLPDDNIFGMPCDPVAHECVADGYWALLPLYRPGALARRLLERA
jgi:hypothetical protein